MEPIRTLLVDDNLDFLDRAQRFLETDGSLEVVGTATTGGAGLALARELQPDLVLLDFELPDLRGPLVAARLKAQNPGVRVVVATLHEGAEYRATALAGGADGFVPKSRIVESLLPAIAALFPGETTASRKDLPMNPEPDFPRSSAPLPPVALPFDRLERELAVVRAASRALTVCVDLDFLLREALVPATGSLGAAHGVVLRDDGARPLALQAGIGFSGVDQEELRLGVIEAYHRSGSVVTGSRLVLDLEAFGEGALSRILALAGLESALLLPLRLDDGQDAVFLVAASDRRFLEPQVQEAAGRIAARLSEVMRLALAFARLERQERRSSAIVDGAADAILVLDGDARIVQANRRAETLLRQGTSRLLGRPFAEIVPLLERPRAAGWFAAAAGRGEEGSAALELCRGDGSVVRLDVSVGVTRTDGETLAVLVLREKKDEARAD